MITTTVFEPQIEGMLTEACIAMNNSAWADPISAPIVQGIANKILTEGPGTLTPSESLFLSLAALRLMRAGAII
jgi:hypothetical protein